jgi:hypothetical protein
MSSSCCVLVGSTLLTQSNLERSSGGGAAQAGKGQAGQAGRADVVTTWQVLKGASSTSAAAGIGPARFSLTPALLAVQGSVMHTVCCGQQALQGACNDSVLKH